MNNPNYTPPTSEDDDDTEPSPSVTRPLSVNPTRLNFLLNSKEKSNTDSAEDEDDDAESAVVSPRRRRVAGSLRNLFKRRRPVVALAPVVHAEHQPTDAEPDTEEHIEAASTEAFPPLPIFERHSEERPSVSEQIPVEPPVASEIESTTEEETAGPTAEHTPSGTAEAPASTTAPEVAPVESESDPDADDATPPTPPTPPRPTAAGGGSGTPLPPVFHTAANGAPMPYATGGYNTAPTSTTPNVVVVKKGGVVGPLIAFFAANYLSKRRNKRTEKKLKKTRTEIEDAQRLDKERISRLETVNRTRELTKERPATPEPAQRVVANVIQKAPVTTAESATKAKTVEVRPPAPQRPSVVERQALRVAAAPRTAETAPVAPIITAEAPAARAAATEAAPQSVIAEQYAAVAQRSVEQNEVRRQQSERIIATQQEAEAKATAEKVVAEKVADNRHERIASSTPIISSSSSAQRAAQQQQQAASQQPFTPQQLQQLQEKRLPEAQRHASHEPNTSLYKQSMQIGFLIGLVAMFIGVIAYYTLR